MSRKSTPLMVKQAQMLFEDETERQAFLDALHEGTSREQAMIVLEDRAELGAFPKERSLHWQPSFVTRVVDRFRPAQHPLYAKGAYYCLDLSSVFAATPMLAIEDRPERILDLCASPGGKSVFAWRAFFHGEVTRGDGRLLLGNEIIRKRTSTLIGNYERCHLEGAGVASADTAVWARRARELFDLVLVDAPCSGQSLIAKGDEAPGCFHPQMIDMNHSRQRRISGNAYHAVRPGGHLLYMTCTYSRKENEKVIEWLLREYPDLEAVEVPALAPYRSRYTEAACYRLFPQSGYGAGAFTCLLRKAGEAPLHREPLPDSLPIFWRFGDAPKAPREIEEEEPDTDASDLETPEPTETARQVVRRALGLTKPDTKAKDKPSDGGGRPAGGSRPRSAGGPGSGSGSGGRPSAGKPGAGKPGRAASKKRGGGPSQNKGGRGRRGR